jgi:hypothetical protein
MLVAYPGKDQTYLEEMLADNALSLSRPVIPYGLLGIQPCTSRYFNLSEHGFRSIGRTQPWPPRQDKHNIFFFGGSTTLGFNQEDSEAIPAHLQRFLDRSDVHCEVYNLGSGNYTSRHEALLFLHLLDEEHIPGHAIFLDGYNECLYAFGNPDLVNALNELYQSEKTYRRSSYFGSILRFAVNAYGARRKALPSSLGYQPNDNSVELDYLLSDQGIKNALRTSSRPDASEEGADFRKRISERTWNRYLNSVGMIRSLASRQDVKTLFAWQPVPFHGTTGAQRVLEGLYLVYRPGVLASPIYNWLEISGFPEMMDCDDFLDLSLLGEDCDSVLYVDHCHYTGDFSRRIAETIGAKLISDLP